MKPGRWILAALLLAAAFLAFRLWRGRAQPQAGDGARVEALFSGKEPKRRVRLLFPAADKPGLVEETPEIFATASKAAQAKQVLRLLFAGPAGTAGARLFPPDWRYRELFLLENGLAVLDLDPAGLKGLPGGTSSEYLALYTMIKALTDNFKELRKVQILVGGRPAESLAGHLSLSEPLSPSDL